MQKINTTYGLKVNQELNDEEKELAAKEFAAEVKRLRAKFNMPQETLSLLLHVRQPIITRIENGTYGITLDLVYRLAVAFNDDPHRLADIFWGIISDKYKNPDKELLDTIWGLMSAYYQPQVVRQFATDKQADTGTADIERQFREDFQKQSQDIPPVDNSIEDE